MIQLKKYRIMKSLLLLLLRILLFSFKFTRLFIQRLSEQQRLSSNRATYTRLDLLTKQIDCFFLDELNDYPSTNKINKEKADNKKTI